MAAASNYLAEDIIFTILSWLPVLSLLRCKTVCKSWNKIISSPEFIRIHLANSHQKQPCVLRFGKIRKVQDIYIDNPEDSIRLHLPQYRNGMYYHTRSCNGLVCVANYFGNVIHVCNPLIKWLMILPTPNIIISYVTGHTLGFGFDSVGNDYKLLRIVKKIDGNANLRIYAEVYSANANSWKLIKAPETVHSFNPYPNARCVQDKNGVLYLDGKNDQLLSFDLHTEELGLFAYPNTSHHIKKSKILDFEGSIAVIYEPVDVESVLSLWMLDNVCGKMSWIKKFNFEVPWVVDRVFLYLGCGYFVTSNSYDGYFFHDYKKKKTKKFLVPAPTLQVVSIDKYTDTLVSFSERV